MSRKELPRPGLVNAALAGRISNREGAVALGITLRQFQRLKQRVREQGVTALRHQGRGRPSPGGCRWRWPDKSKRCCATGTPASMTRTSPKSCARTMG